MKPAERLLQELGISTPSDIDLPAIAFHLGAKVRYRKLHGCEARIIGRNDEAIITIGTHCAERRKRFSLAHEIGHWTHHRGKSLVCRVEESAPQGKMSPERVANDFAADLLMPPYLFDPIGREFAKLNLKAVLELAETFNTSREATAIRLVESGHSPALLVCHGLRGRKWFVRGPDVPSKWFPKSELDSESFAFGVLFGKAPDDPNPRKIGADAWFDSRGSERYEVHEQTMRTATNETYTIVLISDADMLED